MDFIYSSLGEFIFVAALITLGLTVIVRLPKIFITQVVLISTLIFIPAIQENTLISYLVFSLQLGLIIFALYKYKRIADINYQLILEKTHQIPRLLTAGGNWGDKNR